MQLLGIYIGNHDSNICATVNGRVRYRKFERLSGIKHQRVSLAEIQRTCDEWRIKPDAVAFSDGNRNDLGACLEDELFRPSNVTFGLGRVRRSYCVDHHYAHILSVWPLGIPPTGSLGAAIDGRGDHRHRTRIIRLGDGYEAENIRHSDRFLIGMFFSRLGRAMKLPGQAIDYAGKIMGLQAYGDLDETFVSSLDGEDPEDLPKRLFDEIAWRGQIPASDPNFFSIENSSFRDWLCSTHYALSHALSRFLEQSGFGTKPAVYAGGVAQNAVFNESLLHNYPRLLIPPHAYDGGISLGCVEFLRRLLGQPPLELDGFPFVQDDEDMGLASQETISRVVDLLLDGRIIGWMQGRGEIGPRALGHRSILIDPRRPDAQKILNDRVKRREFWRPYACSVLEEYVGSWFDATRPSPFMLQAIRTREECSNRIPAVVHRDGTCRLQSVGHDQELDTFRDLIVGFHDRTGIPLVLNTSLNGGGQPIFGCRAQAIEMFSQGRLDALCLGDKLMIV